MTIWAIAWASVVEVLWMAGARKAEGAGQADDIPRPTKGRLAAPWISSTMLQIDVI